MIFFCKMFAWKNKSHTLINLQIPISGTKYSHVGNEMFPNWESNIPKLGINFVLVV